MANLTALEVAILAAFRKIDPENEYQHNAWSPTLSAAVQTEAEERGANWSWAFEETIPGLARKGYLAAEGRGKFRQFWLSEKGIAALKEHAPA